MGGIELLGIISGAAVVVAIVLRDARSREKARIQFLREADEVANVVRADVLTAKRAEAYRKMRRHRIKNIAERESIGIYRDVKEAKPARRLHAVGGKS